MGVTPKTGHTGPPRGLKKVLDTWKYFQSVWSKVRSRLALLNRAKPLACTMESVGVCHARPQGPGRARDGPVSNLLPSRSHCLPVRSWLRTGQKTLTPRSHSDSAQRRIACGTASEHIGMSVRHMGVTPKTGHIVPPRGLKTTLRDTWKIVF